MEIEFCFVTEPISYRLCPAFRLPDGSVGAKDQGGEGVKLRHSGGFDAAM